MSPVEDIATTIAASVRANGWLAEAIGQAVWIDAEFRGNGVCRLYCKDEHEAKRLAAMMRKPAVPVFEAMGFSPFPTFPSVKKS